MAPTSSLSKPRPSQPRRPFTILTTPPLNTSNATNPPNRRRPQQPATYPAPIQPHTGVPRPASVTNWPRPHSLSEIKGKFADGHYRGLMAPSGPALQHPAAELLDSYAQQGVPADCGEHWTIEHLDLAVAKGAHSSATDPIAAKALYEETQEQIAGGFARLVPWRILREKMLQQLKLSPIAAIPHKSRAFRKILDLSFALNDDFLSVNDASPDDQAPILAMHELGKVLPRIIHAMATVPDNSPLLFAKLDLKDGYWRMVVPDDAEYNFAYVLPQINEDEELMIVIPSALQMGWKLSPPYFCAASETARDVTEDLLDGKHGPLPPHRMEDQLLPADVITALRARVDWTTTEPLPNTCQDNLFRLLEVYIDDFIGVIQSRDPTELLQFSRALLHGIHSVFPPPDITGHGGHDPISEKKLAAGDGLWETRKEILGWIFDGVVRTIELPEDKVEKILATIKEARRRTWMPRKAFESLRGKLQHATLGLPEGRSLLGPFDRALAAANHRKKTVQIHRGSPLDTALVDFALLLSTMHGNPTHCKQLVPGKPGYLGYVNSCISGVGGAWLPGTHELHPTVWRFEWPQDIQDRVVSWTNPTGTLTINDLEMAGFLLQFLVLEELVGPLTHEHIAIWCDNTSAVSWIRKMKSARSAVGQRLARILCLRMSLHKISPLAALSIAGIENELADIASRSYTNKVPSTCKTDAENQMATGNTVHQDLFSRLLRIATREAELGVVEATSKKVIKYWNHWTQLCLRNNVDPLLRHETKTDSVNALMAYARWVREGHAGKGRQVQCGSVSGALCAIGSKFEMDEQPNPLYKPGTEKTYWKRLSMLLEAYRRDDPPPQPQLAVPVAVANHAHRYARTAFTAKEEAIGDLTTIAFYFLLRVGEYTYNSSKKRRRTQQFRVKDVTLRAHGRIIPNTAPLKLLLTATEATLKISNQKNGTRGQLIHHHAPIGVVDSPISALAYRIAHIMAHTADADTPISAYFTTANSMHHIVSGHINKFVKSSIVTLGYTASGFDPKLVSSHSLRAGGAMAMKLNGIDRDTIKKFGRWSSDTFLMYLHEQISAFSSGVSTRMSNHIQFHNIAGPTLVEPVRS